MIKKVSFLFLGISIAYVFSMENNEADKHWRPWVQEASRIQIIHSVIKVDKFGPYGVTEDIILMDINDDTTISDIKKYLQEHEDMALEDQFFTVKHRTCCGFVPEEIDMDKVTDDDGRIKDIMNSLNTEIICVYLRSQTQK